MMKLLIIASVLSAVSVTAHSEEEFTPPKVPDYAALQEKIENERLSTAPGYLRTLPTIDLCEAYGRAVRGEFINQLGNTEAMQKLVKAEAKRRKLKFDDRSVKDEEISLHINECALVAVWGKANRKNTYVNSNSVHVQHVYGTYGPYITTVNGIVVSWQN